MFFYKKSNFPLRKPRIFGILTLVGLGPAIPFKKRKNPIHVKKCFIKNPNFPPHLGKNFDIDYETISNYFILGFLQESVFFIALGFIAAIFVQFSHLHTKVVLNLVLLTFKNNTEYYLWCPNIKLLQSGICRDTINKNCLQQIPKLQ